jgi:hypothetical protein
MHLTEAHASNTIDHMRDVLVVTRCSAYLRLTLSLLTWMCVMCRRCHTQLAMQQKAESAAEAEAAQVRTIN